VVCSQQTYFGTGITSFPCKLQLSKVAISVSSPSQMFKGVVKAQSHTADIRGDGVCKS
jgi:hypothetical protein